MARKSTQTSLPGIGCIAAIVIVGGLSAQCLPKRDTQTSTDGDWNNYTTGTRGSVSDPTSSPSASPEVTEQDYGITAGMNVAAIDYYRGYSYGGVKGEYMAVVEKDNPKGFYTLWRAGQLEHVKAGTVGYVQSLAGEDQSTPRNVWVMVDFGPQEGLRYTILKMPTYMLKPSSKALLKGTTKEWLQGIKADQKRHGV